MFFAVDFQSKINSMRNGSLNSAPNTAIFSLGTLLLLNLLVKY